MAAISGNVLDAMTEGPRLAGGGNEFYESRFDSPAVPEASSRYIFFSSQRTGSNYLCRRLCNVNGRFGLPAEYLNPKAITAIAARVATKGVAGPQELKLGEYLRRVERIRTTADGYFGIKVQPRQLVPRLEGKNDRVVSFLRKFERIIVLTRRNKLAQAVSGSIADATGNWFSIGNSPDLDDSELERLCPDVAFKLNRYIQEESLMAATASQAGRPVLRIEYEEILAEPEETFGRLLAFLGEPRGIAGVEERRSVLVPEKGEGTSSRRLKEKFLAFIEGGADQQRGKP